MVGVSGILLLSSKIPDTPTIQLSRFLECYIVLCILTIVAVVDVLVKPPRQVRQSDEVLKSCDQQALRMCSPTRRASGLAHSKCASRLGRRHILQRAREEGHLGINLQRSCTRFTELFVCATVAPFAAAGAKACGCLGFWQGSHTQHTAGCHFCFDAATRLALLGRAFAAEEKRQLSGE